MSHQTNNKNVFQLTLFTLFSSLLLVGTMSVSSAQAEDLVGKAKGTTVCEDANFIAVKSKFKEDITILGIDTLGLPGSMSATVDTGTGFSGGPLDVDGIAHLKNLKKGFFSMNGETPLTGDSQLAMEGVYKSDNAGEILKVSGRFQLIDNVLGCITSGKFKAKTAPVVP